MTDSAGLPQACFTVVTCSHLIVSAREGMTAYNPVAPELLARSNTLPDSWIEVKTATHTLKCLSDTIQGFSVTYLVGLWIIGKVKLSHSIFI